MVTNYCFVLILASLSAIQVHANFQSCQGKSQYDQCSTNGVCGCLHTANNANNSICAFLWVTCSELIGCASPNNMCYEPDHICVHHPRCFDGPMCYPLSKTKEDICPSIINSKNHRIVKWEPGATAGQIVAGGKGSGNSSDQLNHPSDVVVDRDGTIYISDTENRRIQQWSRGAKNGKTVIKDVSSPVGITRDQQGLLYVCDWEKGEVRKWRVSATAGQIVASRLGGPRFIFIDQNQSIYVAEQRRDRVVKANDAIVTQPSILAGVSLGDNLNQLWSPYSVIVDASGTLYIADTNNHRIMRWARGAQFGKIIAGGRGMGSRYDQLSYPHDLSFDLNGNLYVVDYGNHRVQKFVIDKSLC
ncbi:unnamed protein product [Rotaria magnacalcarata]|uniref:Uncharacterized protein n=1 Tax=Rotaria magnacalcarata TaxID=392030 RepID=A0A8S2KSV3_9BILA|nr:unnamed protein product [Rotaria magnacalcarata]